MIDANVERIAAIERKTLLARSPGARVIDVIVGLGGTPLFALGYVVWFGCWTIANVAVVKGLPTFDPYSFPFLTFLVSLEAIFLSIA